MEGRKWAGYGLLALASFMFIGFLGSSRSLASPSTIVALAIVVLLPAISGIALLRGIGRGDKARYDRLRQATIEAEVMKLAIAESGKLTAIEVATQLSLQEDEAKRALDSMVEREIADIEITDDGVLVYTFDSAKRIGGKETSRGILDA
jgi:hypothetical protein